MTYADLEDAILTALAVLKSENGVKTIDAYAGEFSPDSFGQLHIPYPAVYICIEDLQSEPANQVDKRDLVVAVYAASKNLRGEKAARRGDNRTAGGYELIEAARGKLNRLIIPGSGRLVLRRERLIGYSKALGLCVIKAEYQLKTQQ